MKASSNEVTPTIIITFEPQERANRKTMIVPMVMGANEKED